MILTHNFEVTNDNIRAFVIDCYQSIEEGFDIKWGISIKDLDRLSRYKLINTIAEELKNYVYEKEGAAND